MPTPIAPEIHKNHYNFLKMHLQGILDIVLLLAPPAKEVLLSCDINTGKNLLSRTQTCAVQDHWFCHSSCNILLFIRVPVFIHESPQRQVLLRWGLSWMNVVNSQRYAADVVCRFWSTRAARYALLRYALLRVPVAYSDV